MPVTIGRLAVVPIRPPLVMLPWVWLSGVRASDRRESSARTAWVALETPLAAKSTDRVPLVVMGPPVRPVPLLTCVTVPVPAPRVVGSYRLLDVLHTRPWPLDGAPELTALPCSWATVGPG